MAIGFRAHALPIMVNGGKEVVHWRPRNFYTLATVPTDTYEYQSNAAGSAVFISHFKCYETKWSQPAQYSYW